MPRDSLYSATIITLSKGTNMNALAINEKRGAATVSDPRWGAVVSRERWGVERTRALLEREAQP